MGATHRYDDIIDRARPVSRNHPPMSMESRAAQFSPFAALTGYEAVIAETARRTEDKCELDEEQKLRIGRRLALLGEHIREAPDARVRYFVPDDRKAGGAERLAEGPVKKVDAYAGVLFIADAAIPFEDIYTIESELFRRLGE